MWETPTHCSRKVYGKYRNKSNIASSSMKQFGIYSFSGLGSKMGMDATNKLPGETSREWGEPIVMDQTVIDKIDSIWHQLGLDSSPKLNEED